VYLHNVYNFDQFFTTWLLKFCPTNLPKPLKSRKDYCHDRQKMIISIISGQSPAACVYWPLIILACLVNPSTFCNSCQSACGMGVWPIVCNLCVLWPPITILAVLVNSWSFATLSDLLMGGYPGSPLLSQIWLWYLVCTSKQCKAGQSWSIFADLTNSMAQLVSQHHSGISWPSRI